MELVAMQVSKDSCMKDKEKSRLKELFSTINLSQLVPKPLTLDTSTPESGRDQPKSRNHQVSGDLRVSDQLPSTKEV